MLQEMYGSLGLELSGISVNKGTNSRLGWAKCSDLYEIVHPSSLERNAEKACCCFPFFRATTGASNPNLHVFSTHASHICSQHSFGLPFRVDFQYRVIFTCKRT